MKKMMAEIACNSRDRSITQIQSRRIGTTHLAPANAAGCGLSKV
jgi:hypothetical protein